jgi:hypothetical protein
MAGTSSPSASTLMMVPDTGDVFKSSIASFRETFRLCCCCCCCCGREAAILGFLGLLSEVGDASGLRLCSFRLGQSDVRFS